MFWYTCATIYFQVIQTIEGPLVKTQDLSCHHQYFLFLAKILWTQTRPKWSHQERKITHLLEVTIEYTPTMKFESSRKGKVAMIEFE